MKKVAIIQARMGSTRFPGKVLASLKGKALLHYVVEKATQIPTIDEVIVTTSTLDADNAIQNWCATNKVNCFRGDETDVLKRFYDAAKANKAAIVVRITADCPLLDQNLAGQVLHLVAHCGADYASNILPATWPDGLDCEAFTFAALEHAYKEAHRPSDREHVTPYIRNNHYKFKVMNIPSPIPGLQNYRWTVDSRDDLNYIDQLLSLSKDNPTTYDIIETIKKHRDVKQPAYIRNEGFAKSLTEEEIYCTDVSKSQELLQRALKTIPLGSQTFSKAYIQYPEKTSPLFLTHGQGSRVWDVDGNEYIDLVSGLLPNVLGYNDPDVNFAIQHQLQKGISFSLSTELEIQLAEKLCSIIPSAEKIRFGKNGTDVTSAAIRLARAYTGRDKIATCGYHGWQDWYIGSTTRNKGVPKAVCGLTSPVPYNDLNQLETLLKTKEYAAVIMEPCNTTMPAAGYLQGVKDLCETHGSVFILDEIITGFRFALGGAQQYFGVTPHLSCFGKAMGNGMPISAIVGCTDIMKEMEEIFFSGTFGGEALSIAAAIATIDKIEKEDVTDQLWSFGKELATQIQTIINDHDLNDVIGILGLDPWRILSYKDIDSYTSFDIKTLFIQEMTKRGILINGSFNINFAHTILDQDKIVAAFKQTAEILSRAVHKNEMSNLLVNPTIKPLFKVR
ncbi:aminotransferase class III-fold pyridoxal phosphate-dependent enzyme [Candidatus Odyssella acanthamoebae]|uniref:aminotransferase class III-fold pyridoxal phosphate-dependent enzyme n=1 Tax=Candidatus Odyssella acanthamoebae TaxID=91604 RepID=UPI00056E1B63|nr:aminotransferase class III-fold pyridoxal phosphate-dependent enzyme [Candidatus Paracaedibacter acanthamoebae]